MGQNYVFIVCKKLGCTLVAERVVGLRILFFFFSTKQELQVTDLHYFVSYKVEKLY